jgi:hypothetical protein
MQQDQGLKAGYGSIFEGKIRPMAQGRFLI